MEKVCPQEKWKRFYNFSYGVVCLMATLCLKSAFLERIDVGSNIQPMTTLPVFSDAVFLELHDNVSFLFLKTVECNLRTIYWLVE